VTRPAGSPRPTAALSTPRTSPRWRRRDSSAPSSSVGGKSGFAPPSAGSTRPRGTGSPLSPPGTSARPFAAVSPAQLIPVVVKGPAARAVAPAITIRGDRSRRRGLGRSHAEPEVAGGRAGRAAPPWSCRAVGRPSPLRPHQPTARPSHQPRTHTNHQRPPAIYQPPIHRPDHQPPKPESPLHRSLTDHPIPTSPPRNERGETHLQVAPAAQPAVGRVAGDGRFAGEKSRARLPRGRRVSM
jgi:hypothetical protein